MLVPGVWTVAGAVLPQAGGELLHHAPRHAPRPRAAQVQLPTVPGLGQQLQLQLGRGEGGQLLGELRQVLVSVEVGPGQLRPQLPAAQLPRQPAQHSLHLTNQR